MILHIFSRSAAAASCFFPVVSGRHSVQNRWFESGGLFSNRRRKLFLFRLEYRPQSCGGLAANVNPRFVSAKNILLEKNQKQLAPLARNPQPGTLDRFMLYYMLEHPFKEIAP